VSRACPGFRPFPYDPVLTRSDAKVWFEDIPTKQTGTLREFEPPLTPGLISQCPGPPHAGAGLSWFSVIWKNAAFELAGQE
jgi:hypothetical protein